MRLFGFSVSQLLFTEPLAVAIVDMFQVITPSSEKGIDAITRVGHDHMCVDCRSTQNITTSRSRPGSRAVRLFCPREVLNGLAQRVECVSINSLSHCRHCHPARTFTNQPHTPPMQVVSQSSTTHPAHRHTQPTTQPLPRAGGRRHTGSVSRGYNMCPFFRIPWCRILRPVLLRGCFLGKEAARSAVVCG